MTLGEYISKKRIERDLTVFDLAILVNIDFNVIYRYQKDRVVPRRVTLDKIIKVLKLSEGEKDVIIDLHAKAMVTKYKRNKVLDKDKSLIDMALTIKDYRLKLGLSQKALANKVGINRSALTAYEAGSMIPKDDTVDYIANAVRMDENQKESFNAIITKARKVKYDL